MLFDLTNCPGMAASVHKPERKRAGGLAALHGVVRSAVSEEMMAHLDGQGHLWNGFPRGGELHFCDVLGIPLGDSKMDLCVFSFIPIG